jgi:hypothetical protein
VNKAHVHELLYQALETEQGGTKVYETALTIGAARAKKARKEML